MTGTGWNPKKSRPRGVLSRGPGVHERSTKAAGGLVCRDCGIIQHRGRWYFGAPPVAELTAGHCPACQRVRERYPAGTLRLPSDVSAQRAELLALIRNVEEAEKAEHPLERLMDVEESGGRLVVTTTGVHLARELAHKLGRQLHRKPRFRYADAEDLLHVDWEESSEDGRNRR